MSTLRVNETKINAKKAFNQYHFEIEGNRESDNSEKNMFLQTLDFSFNS